MYGLNDKKEAIEDLNIEYLDKWLLFDINLKFLYNYHM